MPMIKYLPPSSLRAVQPHEMSRVSDKRIKFQGRRRPARVDLYQTSRRPLQVPAFTITPHVSPRQSHRPLLYSAHCIMLVESSYRMPETFRDILGAENTSCDKPVVICLRESAKTTFSYRAASDTKKRLLNLAISFAKPSAVTGSSLLFSNSR